MLTRLYQFYVSIKSHASEFLVITPDLQFYLFFYCSKATSNAQMTVPQVPLIIIKAKKKKKNYINFKFINFKNIGKFHILPIFKQLFENCQ